MCVRYLSFTKSKTDGRIIVAPREDFGGFVAVVGLRTDAQITADAIVKNFTE